MYDSLASTILILHAAEIESGISCAYQIHTTVPVLTCFIAPSLQPIDFIPALKDSPDYLFRILVVGDTFVGKSSYLDRLCNNTFSQNFSSTVGMSCSHAVLTLPCMVCTS